MAEELTREAGLASDLYAFAVGASGARVLAASEERP
jgi:hypothetical protein